MTPQITLKQKEYKCDSLIFFLHFQIHFYLVDQVQDENDGDDPLEILDNHLAKDACVSGFLHIHMLVHLLLIMGHHENEFWFSLNITLLMRR